MCVFWLAETANFTFIYNLCWQKYSLIGERNTYSENAVLNGRRTGWLSKPLLELNG